MLPTSWVLIARFPVQSSALVFNCIIGQHQISRGLTPKSQKMKTVIQGLVCIEKRAQNSPFRSSGGLIELTKTE